MDTRILTPADAAAFWHLRLEALATNPRAFGSSPEEHHAVAIDGIADRIRMDPPGDFHLGSFDGDRLVAIARFVRERNLKERHKAHLYGVYVTASHAGRGVGRALLQSLLNTARGQPGLEQVLLSVAADNPHAARLYRSLGFEPFGTEPHALKIGEAYVDEVHMVAFLHAPQPPPPHFDVA